MWSAAMPKYFKSLSFSQLLFKDRVFSTHSRCLCSERISDSSKSSQSQIDFFLLTFFFHFGHWSQTNKRDLPSQQAAYDGCVAAPRFGRWLSSKVAFVHNARDQLYRASPGHPGQLEQNQEGFPWSPISGILLLSILYNTHLSQVMSLMSWCSWWCFGDRPKCSLLSLNPHIFWSHAVKRWQLLVTHTVFYHLPWLQSKGN